MDIANKDTSVLFVSYRNSSILIKKKQPISALFTLQSHPRKTYEDIFFYFCINGSHSQDKPCYTVSKKEF